MFEYRRVKIISKRFEDESLKMHSIDLSFKTKSIFPADFSGPGHDGPLRIDSLAEKKHCFFECLENGGKTLNTKKNGCWSNKTWRSYHRKIAEQISQQFLRFDQEWKGLKSEKWETVYDQYIYIYIYIYVPSPRLSHQSLTWTGSTPVQCPNRDTCRIREDRCINHLKNNRRSTETLEPPEFLSAPRMPRYMEIFGSFHEQTLAIHHLSKWSRTKVVVRRHHDIAEVFLGQKEIRRCQMLKCWTHVERAAGLIFGNFRPCWVVMAHLTSRVVLFRWWNWVLHVNWALQTNKLG